MLHHEQHKWELLFGNTAFCPPLANEVINGRSVDVNVVAHFVKDDILLQYGV